MALDLRHRLPLQHPVEGQRFVFDGFNQTFFRNLLEVAWLGDTANAESAIPSVSLGLEDNDEATMRNEHNSRRRPRLPFICVPLYQLWRWNSYEQTEGGGESGSSVGSKWSGR
jgi:hypothetical protein